MNISSWSHLERETFFKQVTSTKQPTGEFVYPVCASPNWFLWNSSNPWWPNPHMVEPGSILMPITSDALTSSLKNKQTPTWLHGQKISHRLALRVLAASRYVAHYCKAHQTPSNKDQQIHQRFKGSSYNVIYEGYECTQFVFCSTAPPGAAIAMY